MTGISIPVRNAVLAAVVICLTLAANAPDANLSAAAAGEDRAGHTAVIGSEKGEFAFVERQSDDVAADEQGLGGPAWGGPAPDEGIEIGLGIDPEAEDSQHPAAVPSAEKTASASEAKAAVAARTRFRALPFTRRPPLPILALGHTPSGVGAVSYPAIPWA